MDMLTVRTLSLIFMFGYRDTKVHSVRVSLRCARDEELTWAETGKVIWRRRTREWNPMSTSRIVQQIRVGQLLYTHKQTRDPT